MPKKSSKSKSRKNQHSKARLIRLTKLQIGLLFSLIFAGVAAVLLIITHAASNTTPVHQMYYSTDYPIRIYTLYPSAFAGSYHDEGEVFHAYSQAESGTSPVYQWHKDGVGYIYTLCASGCFESQGWIPDAVAFYAYGSPVNGAVAIHQQHIGSVPYFIYTTCSTCFTSAGWVEDGIAFYAFASAQTAPPPQTPPPTSTPPPSTSTPPSTPNPTQNPPSTSQNPSQPNPSNVPSPKTSSPALQGGGTRQPQSIAVPQAGSSPDTTPPSIPTDFSAQADDQGISIKLSWQAATDDSGNVNYHLERSTDQQDWQAVADSTTDTNYTDTDIKFATHYYYRIRAVDGAGNASDFVMADTATSAFTNNASPDQDITLTDDYNHIQAKLPAGALSDLASCSIESSTFKTIQTALKGYTVVSGPFQILCKKADSSIIDSFNKPVAITWTLVPPKNVAGALEYYGNETKQSKLAVTLHNGKTHTDTFTLDKGTTFAAMGKVKHSSVLLKIFEIVAGIIVVIALVLAILYRRYRHQQQAQYDDYMHKNRGI